MKTKLKWLFHGDQSAKISYKIAYKAGQEKPSQGGPIIQGEGASVLGGSFAASPSPLLLLASANGPNI